MVFKHEKTCYSGGADGSDYLFDVLSKDKYNIVVWSFQNHSRKVTSNAIVRILDNETLNVYSDKLLDVIKKLRRRVPSNKYVYNLLLRDAFQINGIKRETEMVLAISTFSKDKINGGTGYAIEFAKLKNKPIFVLNKEDLLFYKFNYDSSSFEKVDDSEVKEHYNKVEIFTGIGSRDIDFEKVKARIYDIIGDVNEK